MPRYYFTIKLLPEKANLALLTGRCISILHGYICRHGITGIGVSFPAWSDESIGNIIAFVYSESDVLNRLRLQGYFKDMQECGFFEVSKVELVPEGCAEVRFKRNQGIAKMFVGEARRRLKRLEKRALARGEIFNPSKSVTPREFEVFHRVAMSSVGSKQDYLLHIQKHVVDKQMEPMFSSYGFATNERLNGTVPELSHMV
ncbi:type I-F CRISPR-associated endoribonuclease Cas6/Csy4 [Shewanella maritima]|uniref:Type I-F CRISPR-associated endoribonuclease Cas6/Csy4 n=1 Tax=Shewanella maritima TaxID=2520507 RepID=A0A411PGJ6_9GAMM|nr:type I-F CRISPR-associated endoribonuclease Cas6/Csy4 [Shewanella maritima]QBF82618.1 type I-F CRISPR-associated endoribonuclease Cas6/Csy4 [Shewanella maritima]